MAKQTLLSRIEFLMLKTSICTIKTYIQNAIIFVNNIKII